MAKEQDFWVKAHGHFNGSQERLKAGNIMAQTEEVLADTHGMCGGGPASPLWL